MFDFGVGYSVVIMVSWQGGRGNIEQEQVVSFCEVNLLMSCM